MARLCSDAVDPLDSNYVTVDHVKDPVRTGAQPVVPSPVESLSGIWVISQPGDGHVDSAHAVLIAHVTAR